MKALLLALLGTAIFCQPVFARPRSDLEMQLVEGAKKEKKLVFYTTMDLPQNIEVVRDFAERYPFLDLELHPLEAETLVKRIQNEARSGTLRGMFCWPVVARSSHCWKRTWSSPTVRRNGKRSATR